MTLLDIFTPSILISLGISLLLIGLLGMYFMGKCITQDHKIASMFGLVSSMAEEMHFMREKIQSVKFNPSGVAVSEPLPPYNTTLPFLKEENNTSSFQAGSTELIDVSDDDNDDNSSTSSSDVGDSGSEDDSSEGSNDDDIEEVTSIQITNITPDDNDNKSNIKIINVGDSFNINFSEIDELTNNIENINSGTDGGNGDDNDSDDEGIDDDNDTDTDDISVSSNNNKINIIDASVSDSAKSNSALLNTSNILKTINMTMTNLDEHDESANEIKYNKMSLNKLKQLVVDKKLVSNITTASKLKKPDLLKLLNSD